MPYMRRGKAVHRIGCLAWFCSRCWRTAKCPVSETDALLICLPPPQMESLLPIVAAATGGHHEVRRRAVRYGATIKWPAEP